MELEEHKRPETKNRGRQLRTAGDIVNLGVGQYVVFPPAPPEYPFDHVAQIKTAKRDTGTAIWLTYRDNPGVYRDVGNTDQLDRELPFEVYAYIEPPGTLAQRPPPSEIGGPPQTNVRAEVAAVLSQPETQMQEMFRDPNRAFLIVEDDLRAAQKIIISLKERRGTKDQQNDTGVISVESVTGASDAIDSLVKEGGPSKITVILDIEFPGQDGGPPYPRAGHEVLKQITEKVQAWNEAHKANPITLEIIMNSTTVRKLEQAKALGAVSFSAKKDQAVEAVADYFKQSSS